MKHKVSDLKGSPVVFPPCPVGPSLVTHFYAGDRVRELPEPLSIRPATITAGDLRAVLDAIIEEHGTEFPVLVDTSYDQGCHDMEITRVFVREGHLVVEA